MEIPYGHRAKIMKRLKDFRSDEIRPSNGTLYEELPIEVAIGEDNLNVNSKDTYDEQEQRRLFQKAVSDFRNANNNTIKISNANETENKDTLRVFN